MTKKERQTIAIAFAHTFYKCSSTPAIHTGANAAYISVRDALKESNPKFPADLFQQEFQSAVALIAQHGDRPCKLVSIKLGKAS